MSQSFFFHFSIVFYIILFYLFLAVLGLRYCVGFSLAAEDGDYSLDVAHGLLVAVTSPATRAQALGTGASVAELGLSSPMCRLWSIGSTVVANGHSCSAARGILPG